LVHQHRYHQSFPRPTEGSPFHGTSAQPWDFTLQPSTPVAFQVPHQRSAPSFKELHFGIDVKKAKGLASPDDGEQLSIKPKRLGA
jgi:hypothetical protein